MIVKVEPEESDLLEYTCAVFGLQFYRFTIENNPLLFQCEIKNDDGQDIDAETAWLLCSSVRNKMELRFLKQLK